MGRVVVVICLYVLVLFIYNSRHGNTAIQGFISQLKLTKIDETLTRACVLFQIQTKFSPFKPGKDPAIYPYDHTKSIPEQVVQSVESSLINLGVDYLDCLVLHSLYADIQDTLTAWRAMEALVPSKVASLSLSNTDLNSLRQVYEAAFVKPSAIQNRFTQDTLDRPNPAFPPDLPYPVVTFDRDIRQYCQRKNIAYAPWGLLWGSLDILQGHDQLMSKAGKKVGISKEIACYALMRDLGGCQISLLCGTSNERRMHETLEGLSKVREYLGESHENRQTWKIFVNCLKKLVDGEND